METKCNPDKCHIRSEAQWNTKLRYEAEDGSMVLLDTIGLGDTEIDQTKAGHIDPRVRDWAKLRSALAAFKYWGQCCHFWGIKVRN